jgi:argininosuccinate lyase
VTLWGGRFGEPPDETMWRFTVDDADRRLLGVDVEGSIAHVEMLGAVGILDEEETSRLTRALEVVLGEARSGEFEFAETDEDVHTAVERRLGEIVGPLAGKLHTGRSRNDQVALDLTLYLLRSGRERIGQLRRLVGVLVDAAEDHRTTIVAMYTHLQQAQSVPLAHHLLAHAWALKRDVERFAGVEVRLGVSPLGAGPGGGSALPLDPGAVAGSLGIARAFDNSIDAVSARDVVAEYVFCAAQAMVNLSRMSEELVLWATSEFAWVTFSDAHTTGSSALPQKKNPDVAELVRGRSAALIGDVAGILSVQKGLPLAYNRDLQEDKRLVFHADDALAGSLDALAGMLAAAVFHPPAPSPWVTAIDLAEALVQRGVPFREAHASVGRLVAELAEQGRDLSTVTAGELESAHTRLTPEDVRLLDPVESAARRRLDVDGQIAGLRRWLSSVS